MADAHAADKPVTDQANEPAADPNVGLPDSVRVFLDLSVALTGYDRAELLGTGMLADYHDTLLRAIGEREAGHFFTAAQTAVAADQRSSQSDEFAAFVQNTRYGPVALSVLKLWYVGSWQPLSRAWRDRFGVTADDNEHIVSSKAYREGLIWAAAGAHPMGAKPTGFGSWASVPAPTGT